MSYTFLLEQGEESSAGCFLDIPACVLSRSNNTAEVSSCSDSETESCRASLFGTTCELSMERRGEGGSTSCAADSHARTSASPAEVLGSTASEAGCGPAWHESFATFDRATSSWRTRQLSLLAGSDVFSETWPRWGMMQDGACWERTMPAHLNCENESGFWPTPKCLGWRSDGELRMLARMVGEDLELFEALSDRACESKKRHFYPTPTKSMAKGSSKGAMVRKDGRSRERDRLDYFLERGETTRGRVNPEWICWLMGWPIGWDALQPLATDRFQSWLRSHGRY